MTSQFVRAHTGLDLLRLQNLATNFTTRVSAGVQVEVPLAIQQILCLFRGNGGLTVERAGDRSHLDGELWFGVGAFRGGTMEVRGNGGSGQAAELNVVLEFVGI